MIKNIAVLADMLKGIKVGGEDFTPDSFKKAFEDDKEIDLTLPKGSFLNDTEIEELKTNVGTGSMRDGVISGSEQTVKAIKKATGLDFEGKIVKNTAGAVDFDATAKLLTGKLTEKVSTDLKLPQDKKVQELTVSLETLRNTFETEKGEWETKDQAHQSKLGVMAKDNFINTHAQGVEGHKPAHLVAAFQADGYSVQFDNGVAIPTLNGAIMKDKMVKPLKFDDVFNDWKIANKYGEASGGRGGGNESGGVGGSKKFETQGDVYKHMKDNDILPHSEAGIKLISDFNASQEA